MQQTNQYKFNIIDTSDTFSPEKLNENAKTAERELARVEAEAAAEAANLRAEFAAADAALAKTMADNKSKTDATITAVEKGANLVHLAGPFETGGSTTVDLSTVDMSQYRALLFFIYSNTTNAGIVIGSRGISLSGVGGFVVWAYHIGENMVHISSYYATASTGSLITGTNGSYSKLDWNTIKTIALSNADGDIYAIKA